MPIKSALPPFCGGFFYVDAATYGGELQTAPKSANAHNVAKKLLSHPNVIFAHPVLGSDDLLVMIAASSPTEFLGAVHGQLRSHFSDKHDYIVRTRSHTITSYYGKKAITREKFDKSSAIEAWILLRVGVPDPAAEIAEILLKDPRITAVAPVLGDFDLFAFVEAASLQELRSVVDETVRGKRHILESTTQLVLR
jgi:DNA-binding Lrp family transcriptional regulator